jgi:GNAT superfamily N-acetyltransferase
MGTFSQAAFRNAEGRVVATGPFHDIDALPLDFEIADEGFVAHDGAFVSRAEATAALNSDHPIQSEELGLEKKEKTQIKQYTFSEPTPSDGGWLKVVAHHQGQQVGTLTVSAKSTSRSGHPHDGYHKIGKADVHPLHRGNGVYGKMLQLASAHVKKLGARGLVSPGEWREEKATGAWERLATKVKGVQRRPGLEPDAPDFFLSEKMSTTSLQTESSPENVDHEWIIQFEHWLKSRQKIQKSDALSQLVSRHGNLGITPNGEDREIAEHMAGQSPENTPEFRAARFLAGKVAPTDEDIRMAMVMYDHDFELAALYAHGLPRNDSFRQMLRSTMELEARPEGLDKSNPENFAVAQMPRIVEAGAEDSGQVVEALRRAEATGNVHAVSLDGKHSKGAAIATDPEDHKKWLIKPGSGKVSPARGVSQEAASQTRREVAFYKIAEICGLSEFFPEAYLVKLDGIEVSVMELLASDYKGLDKVRKKSGMDPRKIFEPYRKNGILFRWALLDWILGNADRHANNIMIHGDEVKLIDHGTTFAGPDFDPAHDPRKSFIPFYLRAWSPFNFSSLDGTDKEAQMPTLDNRIEVEFGTWIDSVPEDKLQSIMEQYGINPEPSLARLRDIKMAKPEYRAHRLIGLWAGTVRPQS